MLPEILVFPVRLSLPLPDFVSEVLPDSGPSQLPALATVTLVLSVTQMPVPLPVPQVKLVLVSA